METGGAEEAQHSQQRGHCSASTTLQVAPGEASSPDGGCTPSGCLTAEGLGAGGSAPFVAS